ncbi:uncharacterized protein LOC134836006 [Culicoides brevitarsis]|uniref:uncharacterized protein LOC134836006 n=1 Tax=Culicoides brevitarsis TaxID=469753 RepID=UPI00307C8955
MKFNVIIKNRILPEQYETNAVYSNFELKTDQVNDKFDDKNRGESENSPALANVLESKGIKRKILHETNENETFKKPKYSVSDSVPMESYSIASSSNSDAVPMTRDRQVTSENISANVVHDLKIEGDPKIVEHVVNIEENENDVASEVKKSKRVIKIKLPKTKKQKLAQSPLKLMLKEAMENLDDSRRGVTCNKLKNYLAKNFDYFNEKAIKTAIKSRIKSGEFINVTGSGLKGSFKMAQTDSQKKPKGSKGKKKSTVSLKNPEQTKDTLKTTTTVNAPEANSSHQNE